MGDKIKRKYRLIFYAILSIFLIVSLATLSDYGMTWDEAAQQHIGKVTIDFLKGKTADFNFQRDDLKYYGPFFEIINYYFSSSLLESFNISYVSAFHILIVLTAALGLLFLFWLVNALLGEQIALFSCAFLMLLPRYAAHAQFNSKDIPLVTFFIIFRFYQKKSQEYYSSWCIFRTRNRYAYGFNFSSACVFYHLYSALNF